MSFDTDVLISGAGAAGLTLAIDLARRGISFRLIEQNTQPFSGSRGKGIQPRTMEIFEDLGIVDRMAASGGPYPPLCQYRADGTHKMSLLTEADVSPTAAEPYAAPLMLPQFATEAVMRERLSELGHHPHFGTRLTGFEQDAHGVTARIEQKGGEQVIRARFLVGTDGGRSFVRHALAIDFPGEALGVRAVVADVRLEGLDRSVWHRFQFGSPATQLVICPLPGTDLFQVHAPVRLDGEIDLSLDGLTGLIGDRSGRRDIAVRSVSWSSVYTMSARLADRYRIERVFLAGDAAHVHPPTGAQGLNTSVQDAYNLGWKLASVLTGAPEALLDSYEAERRPIALNMLRLSMRLLEEVKQGIMRRDREARQLDLGYRGSSLNVPGSAGKKVQAGDRAPDAPCRGQAGQRTRLFTVFQGPHWTLLGYQPHDRPSAIAGVRIVTVGAGHELVDEDGDIAEAYGIGSGQWVLVRPDGYIAGILPSDGLAQKLSCYLAHVLPSRPNNTLGEA
ncbi:FAD-dependent oxidoreductase [Gluconobacter kanchanaburiensis]|uniref:3-(3-hydroxyphenyl)propionate hydroxylase n=1 Tax=Gluconobacter kanchanaburiensis NBRC 103587 TaxID=1307948 RepID=A0A511BB15_9PROT|nr:FAD-dependent oxidoreductase [Gluconobacter kanchanaburiensis]MBF0863084.1 FAD-dependent oxidoreductase [Gluconobacter kanchanaburiensis]GBR71828.1 2-polyprenyl-6-methoxyphenol hydroxylase [Gluconobacter kanchanaburiensis NBRC 103587]GEK97494.1 3-(3-hydroxyphenyl)propionate hydroxylase [Gluconobacter kanchanaburiensis NBRC 103587]